MLRHEALLGPLALGHVLHGAEHTEWPARLVPHHIALTADDPHLAAGPNRAVLHVVPRPAPKRRRLCCRSHVTVCGVEQLLDVVKGQDAFLRPQPKDPVGFVRPGVAVGSEIALPVADVRDALGLLQSALAFAQVPKHQ